MHDITVSVSMDYTQPLQTAVILIFMNFLLDLRL